MTTLDPYNPASRKQAFERHAQIDKARRMLIEIDQACRILDLPLPAGQRGVEQIGELSAVAMLAIRHAAKLDRPPSHETFTELFRLIKERG